MVLYVCQILTSLPKWNKNDTPSIYKVAMHVSTLAHLCASYEDPMLHVCVLQPQLFIYGCVQLQVIKLMQLQYYNSKLSLQNSVSTIMKQLQPTIIVYKFV